MRSAQASMTVRARSGLSDEKLASWSLVKQTTSQRPCAGTCSNMPCAVPAPPSAWDENEGKRFSKTTTS